MPLPQLLAACKRHLAPAQKELVRRFAPALMSVARRYTRRPPDAEDVLQESFISIFKHLDQYDASKGQPITWMRRITINTALQLYRRKGRIFEFTPEKMPDETDDNPDIVARLSFGELLILIDQLPDGAREVFNLSVFDEHSHDEIATLLGIPAGTSRSLLSRARKQLQQQILKLHDNEVVRL